MATGHGPPHGAAQKHHETVFESGLRRAHRRSRQDVAIHGCVRAGDKADLFAIQGGVDHAGGADKAGLQLAGFEGRRRDRTKRHAGRFVADLMRRAGAEDLPLMQDNGLVEAFGFVQIRGADQYGQPLFLYQPGDDLPEVAARHRVHAHGWFIEQQQLRGAQ